MDAWWPKLLRAEFVPTLGTPAFEDVSHMIGSGGTDFTEDFYGQVSKDLRRLFGTEQGPFSRPYCGALPGHNFSTATLRSRCRAALQSSLAAALTVTPQQLYGGVCPTDPQPACNDMNTFTYASAIAIPPFPYQNRPVFQQVVTLTQRLPR